MKAWIKWWGPVFYWCLVLGMVVGEGFRISVEPATKSDLAYAVSIMVMLVVGTQMFPLREHPTELTVHLRGETIKIKKGDNLTIHHKMVVSRNEVLDALLNPTEGKDNEGSGADS